MKNPFRILSRNISTLLAFAAFASAGRAATKVWDGGTLGTGTDLATAANWNADTLPVANDTLQWNGTAAGSLSLAVTNSTQFAAGSLGYAIDLTALQTGSLQIDDVATATANSVRLASITVAAGAGALTLGNGSGTCFLTLGGTGSTANTFTNNSSNAVTFASDVTWGDGNAQANRILTLAGSGDWNMNCVFGVTVAGGNGSLGITKTGTGTAFLNATNTYTSGTIIGTGGGAGIIRAAANQALGTGTVTFDTTGNASTARLELNSATGISLNNAITFSGRANTSVAMQNLSGSNTLSGVVTLAAGGGTYIIQSDAGTLTLSNATSITGGATTGARTVTLQGAGNGVVSGAIVNGSATVGITKDGTGTWTFTGASTYTGPTTITTGTLQIGNGGTAGSLVSAITNNAALVFNRSDASTASGAISGTGTLTKLGAGTLTLTGASSYSGATNINVGTLGFSTNTHSLGSSAFTVADNAGLSVKAAAAGSTLLNTSSLALGTSGPTTLTFDFSSLNTTAPLVSTNAFTANGTVNVNLSNGGGLATGAHTLIDYTSFSGSGTFPAGTYTLSPRSNGTIVNDTVGTLLYLNVVGDAPKWTGLDGSNWQVGTTGANANWKLVTAGGPTDYIEGDVVLFDDSALGSNTVNLTTTLLPGGTTVDNAIGGVTYTFNGAGKISGTGALVKQGNGTLILANTAAYDHTGGTTISNGILQIGDGATSGAGLLPTGTITNNATLAYNRPDDFSVAQTIGGTGAIVKNNTNTVTYTTATTNSTPYAINNGKLKFSAGGNLSGAISCGGQLETSATIQLSGVSANTNSGLTTVSAGQLQLNKTAGVNAVGGDITITGAGQLSLLAGEQVSNSATITLLGTSTDSVLTTALETVGNVIVNSSTLGAAGGQIIMRNGFTVLGTATLTSGVLGVGSGQTGTINTVNITSAPGSNGILRIAGNTAASTLNVGGGGVTASGGEIQVKFNTTNFDAVLNLGGDFTTTGNVIVTNGGYTGASQNIINLIGARSFNIGAGTTTTIAPDLGGSGSLTKSGNGTLTLSASVAGAYTGATTVSAGTLLVQGTLTATPSVAIGTGGTLLLGAADRVNDAAAISLAGGTLNTGGFSETLGTLTLSEDSTIDFGGGASVLTFGDSTALWTSGKFLNIFTTGPARPWLAAARINCVSSAMV